MKTSLQSFSRKLRTNTPIEFDVGNKMVFALRRNNEDFVAIL